MNPLLFADWNRMNRLFTRGMWIIVAILLGIIGVVLLSTGSAAHADQVGYAMLGATGAR
jgi:hypothetical protein